jgi:uncharacterized protein (TIGR02996 family)
MSTGDALLQAIIDEPDDDSLRLIYADWLHDHGQPERAEFIRVEIDLHARVQGRRPFVVNWLDPEYQRLSARRDELYQRHRAAWFGSLASLVRSFTTVRGFVSSVDVTARQFVDRAGEIFAAAPTIETVWSTRLGGNVPAFAQRPELARVRCLAFFDATLGTRGLAMLCASPYLERQRVLEPTMCRVGPEGAGAVGRMPALANLRGLRLCDNPIGDAGARAVFESPHTGAMETLGMRNCSLTGRSVPALVQFAARNPLIDLSIGGNRIPAEATEVLFASPDLAGLRCLALDHNPVALPALARAGHLQHLEELGVGWAGAEDDQLADLLASTVLADVQVLRLAGNSFGPRASAALAAHGLPCVQSLFLLSCNLGASDLQQFQRAAVPALRELDLSGNPLGPAGARALVSGPFLAAVTAVHLSGCDLGDDGAEALAGAGCLAGVRRLFLGGNQIGNRGALALARSPHLEGVRTLSLHSNRIRRAGQKALRERFGPRVGSF